MAKENKIQQDEIHPHFPTGEWEGFYTYYLGPDADRHRMSCTLRFCQNTISGICRDDVGMSLWSGTYDTEQGKCTMLKQYLGKHSVQYKGNADENGIWGIWNIDDNFSGGFHIWPKKQEMEQKMEAFATQKKKNKVEKKKFIKTAQIVRKRLTFALLF